MSTKNLDTGNIFRSVYQPATESLNVSIIGSGTPTLPNVVEISDGTNFLTSTTVGGKIGLDVAIINAPEMVISDLDDSIKIGNGLGVFLDVNADRSINTRDINSFVTVPFDSIFPSYPDAVTEIYVYKSLGVTVATITVIYTDSSKNEFVSMVRT